MHVAQHPQPQTDVEIRLCRLCQQAMSTGYVNIHKPYGQSNISVAYTKKIQWRTECVHHYLVHYLVLGFLCEYQVSPGFCVP